MCSQSHTLESEEAMSSAISAVLASSEVGNLDRSSAYRIPVFGGLLRHVHGSDCWHFMYNKMGRKTQQVIGPLGSLALVV